MAKKLNTVLVLAVGSIILTPWFLLAETLVPIHLSGFPDLGVRVHIYDFGYLGTADHKPALDKATFDDLLEYQKALEEKIARDIAELASVEVKSDARKFLAVYASIEPDWESGMCAVHISVEFDEFVHLERTPPLPPHPRRVTSWDHDELHVRPCSSLGDELEEMILEGGSRFSSKLEQARSWPKRPTGE